MAPAETPPPFLQRKPPARESTRTALGANPLGPGPPGSHAANLFLPAKNEKVESARAKCTYLINHEFRALQLDKQIATMSVFDLIDHCASLFEQLAAVKNSDIDELFRLYVRSFLIFNYFVNTFIMLHFNGFSRFMESSQQDFIIYLNLYNFYRCDDIVGPHAFHISPPTVRAWIIDYLVSKKLLSFDVNLLYAWLDEYIEYLKNKEDSSAVCAASQKPPQNYAAPENGAMTQSQKTSRSEDDLVEFTTRFPDLQEQQLLHSSTAQVPYPVSDSVRNEAALPYPIDGGSQPRKADAMPSSESYQKPPTSQLQLAPQTSQKAVAASYSRDPVPINSINSPAYPIHNNSTLELDSRFSSEKRMSQKMGTDLYYQRAHPMPVIPGHMGTLYPLDSRHNRPIGPRQYKPSPERAENSSGNYPGLYVQSPPRPQHVVQHRPQAHSQQYHEKSKVITRKLFAICGLKNLGSSCYINLTVQVLAGLEKFETLLLQRKKKSTPQPLTEATAGLLTTFNANGGANIAPTKFLRVLSSLKPDFNVPFEQQDAQEFLLFLLDKIHEEMSVKPQGDTVDYLSRWNITVNPRDTEEYLKWYKDLVNHEGESPVNDTFQGHVQSKLVCNKCGHRSVSYSSFTILSLPIPAGSYQTVDLTDCLRYYTQDEVLAGENAWNCPNCNKSANKANPIDVVFQPKRGLFRLKRSKSPAKKSLGVHTANKSSSISLKQLSFIKLPPVMFIHLSRFSMGDVTDKLNTNIIYPLRLKFNNLGHDIVYNLTGLINHYGTLKSGHYTSLVNKAPTQGTHRDPLMDPIWCFFDDDNVRFNVQHGNVHYSDHDKLNSRDVYVLCYERI